LFPDAAIDRLDRDAANDLESYKAILGRVRSGETAILVGTQMIAKGHDLPNVTVVGIADCDVGLHMPDFRASERVFQLLTQASGRAGRGDKAGCVVLQTRVPRHPSLVRTVRDDYLGFAEGELAVRQELSYPPFTRLLRIVASSQDKSAAETRLLNFRSGVRDFIEHHQLAVKVLGPSPAPLERLKTSWRWHMILKADNPIHLLKVMGYLRAEKNTSRKVKVTFDMDPQEML
jgi:primosomal protein N' (replication factor Y)